MKPKKFLWPRLPTYLFFQILSCQYMLLTTASLFILKQLLCSLSKKMSLIFKIIFEIYFKLFKFAFKVIYNLALTYFSNFVFHVFPKILFSNMLYYIQLSVHLSMYSLVHSFIYSTENTPVLSFYSDSVLSSMVSSSSRCLFIWN